MIRPGFERCGLCGQDVESAKWSTPAPADRRADICDDCGSSLNYPCRADVDCPCSCASCRKTEAYWERYFRGMPRDVMRTTRELNAELREIGHHVHPEPKGGE